MHGRFGVNDPTDLLADESVLEKSFCDDVESTV